MLIGNNMDAIKEVKKQLSSKFDMKDLGATNFIMGMEIKRDWVVRNIWLNQRKYIQIILKHFNMRDCKPVKAPMHVGSKLTVKQCPNTQEEIEDMAHVPYTSVVVSLMYAMVFIRPEIFHAMGVLSIYISKSRKEHWIVVKRVFRYLCGTKDYAISYQGKPGVDSEVDVHGFFDVDWVGDMD
jgi:hypothetical protein